MQETLLEMAGKRAAYERGVIAVAEEGFVRTIYFSDGLKEELSVKWREILRVAAFKRDMFAYDLLCLGFETQDGTIEIDEEMEGWKLIIDVLPKHLSGIRRVEDWFTEVVKPAFAANFTVIFPPG